MTVTTQVSRVSYAGNGSTVTFAVPFYFIDKADLAVYLRTSSGDETAQTLTTHYTVSGDGDQSGGSITFLTAPPSGTSVIIYRDPPITQPADYTPNSRFPAESHERALDRGTMVAQRLKDRLDRALELRKSDTDGSGAYDAKGNRITNLGTPTGASDATTKAYVDLAAAQAATGLFTINSNNVTHTDTGSGAVARNISVVFKEAIRSILDFRQTGDPDDTLAFTRAIATGATRFILPEKTYTTGKLVFPSTFKELIAVGRPVISPTSGTFSTTTTQYLRAWDPAVTYATGDGVHFLASPATVPGGIATDGFMYRAVAGSTGNRPARITTLNTTASSTAATVADATGLGTLQKIFATNVAAGTSIAALSGTNVTLSAAATATGSDAATSFVSNFWLRLPFESFWEFDLQQDGVLSGFVLDVNPQTTPYVYALNLAACGSGLHVDRIATINSGAIGVYAGNCVGLRMTNLDIGPFAWGGINMSGTLQMHNFLGWSRVVCPDRTGTGHNITVGYGSECTVTNCDVAGAGSCGVASFRTKGLRSLFNKSKNTYGEGQLHLGLVESKIHGNRAEYDAGITGVGQDFGTSIDGTDYVCSDNEISMNTIVGAGVTGIESVSGASGGSYRNQFFGNRIIDANARNLANEGGMFLTGTNTQGNKIYNNFIFESRVTPQHKFGIAEKNLGLGMPSNNEIGPNFIAQGASVPDIIRGGITTPITDGTTVRVVALTQASGIASGSGTITAATGSLRWRYVGTYIEILELDVTITTLGTATGNILVTLPVAAVAESGIVQGKEIVTTGKAWLGEIAATTIQVRMADNTIAWASGNRFVGAGKYRANAA